MRAWRIRRNWTVRWVTKRTTRAPVTSPRTRSASASRASTARSSATAPRRSALAPCGYDDDGVKTTRVHHHRQGHLPQLPDDARTGASGGRQGIARLLPGRFLGHCAVPAHAERFAAARVRGYHAREPDRGHRRRRADRWARQLFDRSAALQLPVRRRRVLGDQGRQEARHDFARVLSGPHAGFLAGLRRHGRARLTGGSTEPPATRRASPRRSIPSATAARPRASAESTSSSRTNRTYPCLPATKHRNWPRR